MRWLLDLAVLRQGDGWDKPTGMNLNFPCPMCWGAHPPDFPDLWMRYDGWEFRPPFKCMCCGKTTCARQFAYGRTCGLCDTGSCQSGNRGFKPQYAHPNMSWRFAGDRAAQIAAFANESGITAT